MANPQIVYNPGAGTVTLPFTYPPTGVAAYNSVATRHDNVSSAGVRETILERVDAFLELEMNTVLSGADAANWNSFMQYALLGGPFSYYPDSSQAAFTNYWLEQTSWLASYARPGQFKFKLKFRQVVA